MKLKQFMRTKRWQAALNNGLILCMEIKTFFATAHQEWHKSQATTSGNLYSTAPISGASDNAVHQHNKTSDAIAFLATATADDRTTISTLASTNTKVTADLSAVNVKLAVALHEITCLTNVISKLQLSKSRKDGQPGRGTTIEMAVYPIHYCWMHVHSCLHPSHLFGEVLEPRSP